MAMTGRGKSDGASPVASPVAFLVASPASSRGRAAAHLQLVAEDERRQAATHLQRVEEGEQRRNLRRAIQPSSVHSSGSNNHLSTFERMSSQEGRRRTDLWYDIIHSVGQTFNSIEHFWGDLTKYAIARVGTCMQLGLIGGLILRLNNVHICGGGLSTQNHPRASKRWISSIIAEKIVDTLLYRSKDIKKDIFRDYGVDVPYYQAWWGKEFAQKEVHGDERCSFDGLRWYKDAIERSNANSIVNLDVSVESNFKRFFGNTVVKQQEICSHCLIRQYIHIRWKTKRLL
ncbi:hypothetical protein Taro_024390 [Colocasia esculenta]|uniref:Uncharacterized protein n=1 Tax=Colocasia esculenta TaxID=4460 RepID=A0A843VHC8_COLES|nr:hypothetical protein [Colocasia esculenta]